MFRWIVRGLIRLPIVIIDVVVQEVSVPVHRGAANGASPPGRIKIRIEYVVTQNRTRQRKARLRGFHKTAVSIIRERIVHNDRGNTFFPRHVDSE